MSRSGGTGSHVPDLVRTFVPETEVPLIFTKTFDMSESKFSNNRHTGTRSNGLREEVKETVNIYPHCHKYP